MSNDLSQLERWALEDATEEARVWKNGYDAGKQDAVAEVEQLRALLSNIRNYLMGHPWLQSESPDETIRKTLKGK